MDNWFDKVDVEEKPIQLKVERKYRKKSTFPLNPDHLIFPQKVSIFSSGDEINENINSESSSRFKNAKTENTPQQSDDPAPIVKGDKETEENLKNPENSEGQKAENSKVPTQATLTINDGATTKANESVQTVKPMKPVFEEAIFIHEDELKEPSKCRKWTTFIIAVICIVLYAVILGSLLYISIEYKTWDELRRAIKGIKPEVETNPEETTTTILTTTKMTTTTTTTTTTPIP